MIVLSCWIKTATSSFLQHQHHQLPCPGRRHQRRPRRRWRPLRPFAWLLPPVGLCLCCKICKRAARILFVLLARVYSDEAHPTAGGGRRDFDAASAPARLLFLRRFWSSWARLTTGATGSRRPRQPALFDGPRVARLVANRLSPATTDWLPGE